MIDKELVEAAINGRIGREMRLMADAACGHVTDLSAIVPPPCTACAARWFIATIAARLREGR